MTTPGTVALVALDWGTSSCRAYALAADGHLLDTRTEPLGILTVGTDPAAYPAALTEMAADWLAQAGAVLACGMVGSAGGWQDAGYQPAPVDLVAGDWALTRVHPGEAGPPVYLVPGVRTAAGVMRGEETQLLGATLAGLDADPVVLPGTHSKWAAPRAGVLTDFYTAMTGELHALLLAHGTIAQVAAASDATDWEAFDGGARLGLSESAQGVLSLAFGARARVLTGALAPTQVSDHLSGVLIAAEVRGGLAWLGESPQRITLIGSDALCRRYRRVLALAEIDAERPAENLTLTGLRHIARAHGLLPTGLPAEALNEGPGEAPAGLPTAQAANDHGDDQPSVVPTNGA